MELVPFRAQDLDLAIELDPLHLLRHQAFIQHSLKRFPHQLFRDLPMIAQYGLYGRIEGGDDGAAQGGVGQILHDKRRILPEDVFLVGQFDDLGCDGPELHADGIPDPIDHDLFSQRLGEVFHDGMKVPVAGEEDIHVGIVSGSRVSIDIVQHDEVGHILFPGPGLLVRLNNGVRDIPERSDLTAYSLIVAEFSKYHNVQYGVLLIQLFPPAQGIRFHGEKILIHVKPILIIHKG